MGGAGRVHPSRATRVLGARLATTPPGGTRALRCCSLFGGEARRLGVVRDRRARTQRPQAPAPIRSAAPGVARRRRSAGARHAEGRARRGRIPAPALSERPHREAECGREFAGAFRAHARTRADPMATPAPRTRRRGRCPAAKRPITSGRRPLDPARVWLPGRRRSRPLRAGPAAGGPGRRRLCRPRTPEGSASLPAVFHVEHEAGLGPRRVFHVEQRQRDGAECSRLGLSGRAKKPRGIACPRRGTGAPAPGSKTGP